MSDLLLFHHAQGLTPGMRAFADIIRQAGHTVYLPDLYNGHVFDDLDSGIKYAQSVGFETILERGVSAAESLPTNLIYAGVSLGVMPAQKLAQTRPGAAGALFFEACLPVTAFADGWPPGLPVQIHGMESDKWFAGEGDLAAARELLVGSENAELFLYPGDQHLFADSSLPSYNKAAADLLIQRVLAFLRN